MNSNGKRALVLIVTIAAYCAVRLLLSVGGSDVDNYGVPEISVGPGTQNVLTLDIQLPENAGEDVKYFDGDRVSGIGGPITPFDSTTALAGFLNVAGLQDGDTATRSTMTRCSRTAPATRRPRATARSILASRSGSTRTSTASTTRVRRSSSRGRSAAGHQGHADPRLAGDRAERRHAPTSATSTTPASL